MRDILATIISKIVYVFVLPIIFVRAIYMQLTGQLTDHDLLHVSQNQDDPETQEVFMKAILPWKIFHMHETKEK